MKGLITARDVSNGRTCALISVIKMMAVGVGVLGIGLIMASLSYFITQPKSAAGFDQIMWVLGCLKIPGLWIVTPLLVLALGLVLIRTALLPWNQWTAGSIGQVVAAVLFFPSLWWVWNVILIVPDQAWGWRFLGVAAAVLCLAAHRLITGAICRIVFRSGSIPPPALKVSPAS